MCAPNLPMLFMGEEFGASAPFNYFTSFDDPALADARGVHGFTILYHAALSGDPAIAEALVEHGGGTNTDMAVHAAVQSGQLAMVDWLLAHGVADVNPPNFRGDTPYQVALAHGQTAIADRLAAAGGHAAPEQRAG